MNDQPENGAAPTDSEPTQDVDVDVDESPAEGEDEAPLRADLQARDQRIDELARAYSGLLNDQKDYRGRIEREKERVLEAERGKIALNLLQVADEIERALASAPDDQSALARGVRLIAEGLTKTLGTLGLERLKLLGTPYDPNTAEVVDLVQVEDADLDNTVVVEVTPGYKLGERVVRPARVRVARHTPVQ